MGFSITTPGANAQLNQLNLNTDGLEALLSLIQVQTDQLELPIGSMALNLTSIDALTQSLQTLQTQIRDQLQIALQSGGNLTISELANEILNNISGASLLLNDIRNSTDQVEALLARLAGDSTVIAVLSDPHFALPNAAINPLPTHIANAVILVGVKADGTANSADIRYGYNPTDLRFTLSPGGNASIDAPAGKKIDTASVFVQGTVSDGVTIGLLN